MKSTKSLLAPEDAAPGPGEQETQTNYAISKQHKPLR